MQGKQVSNSEVSPPPPSTNPVPPGGSWITDTRLKVALIWAASIATAAALWPVVFNVRAIESFIFFYHIDSDVYRAGAQAFLDGLNLYEQDYVVGGIQLPFTYPPIATVVFTPLLLVKSSVMGGLLTLFSAALMWWCIAIVLRRVLKSISVADSRLFALFILPVALFTEPVNQTLQFGQINIMLMTLVLIDTFTRKPWLPRGFWIGLAASIKLTPAVFGLYFLVKRDWKGAITSIASGIGFTLLAFLLLPESSKVYWTETLSDPSRIGNLSYITNQSLRGLFSRLMHENQDLVEMIWMVGVALTLIGVVVAMSRVLKAGSPHGAVLLNSLIALLCSPVSWSHHWVWLIPIALGFAASAWSQRQHSPATAATAGFMAFLSTVPMLVPTFWNMPYDSEAAPAWPLLLHPSGSSYVVVAVAIVIVAIVNPRVFGTHLQADGKTKVNPLLLGALGLVAIYLAANAWYQGENGNIRSINYPTEILDGSGLTHFGYLLTEPLRSNNLTALWVTGAVNIAALLWCVWIVLQRFCTQQPSVFIFLAALALSLVSAPVQNALEVGALTMLALALLLTDLLSPRLVLPRGLLSGVATGLLGWPLLVIPALLLQRRIKPALIAAITAVLLWAVGWFFAPASANTLLDVQFSVHDGADNASLAAFLARWVSDSGVLAAVWFLIALLVGLWAVARAYAKGETTLSNVLALALPAVALPTVHTHMWVLFIPLLIVLLRSGRIFAVFLAGFVALVNWVPIQVSYDTLFPLNHPEDFNHVGLAGSYLLVEPLTIAPAAIGVLLFLTGAFTRAKKA